MLAVALGAGPARVAGATAESAAVFVRTLAERAEAALADPALTAERRAGKIRALLTETVDIDRVGRFVLGKHLRKLGRGRSVDPEVDSMAELAPGPTTLACRRQEHGLLLDGLRRLPLRPEEAPLLPVPAVDRLRRIRLLRGA